MNIKSVKKLATVCKFTVMLAALALSAMLVVGCSDDGDDDGGGGNNLTPAEIREIDGRLGAGASRLVGDWVFSDGNELRIGNNSAWFISLKSTGEFCEESGLQKVDNFWLESDNCFGETWRVDGNELIFAYDYDDEAWRVTYSVSGNTFTFVECWNENGEEECETYTLSRFNTSSFRTGKNIRTSDPALHRTDWRLDNSGGLEFYVIWLYLWPISRYFDDSHDEYVWYTNGNRLFMIGASETDCGEYWCDDCQEYHTVDCALISEETIEFTYTHTPGVSLRLRSTTLGIDDLWEYQSWDDYMYKRPDTQRTSNKRRATPLFGGSRPRR